MHACHPKQARSYKKEIVIIAETRMNPVYQVRRSRLNCHSIYTCFRPVIISGAAAVMQQSVSLQFSLMLGSYSFNALENIVLNKLEQIQFDAS